MIVLELDVRKALVVPQDDVEPRPVLLDEVVLEQQRLGVGVGDRDLDVRDLLDQREGLRLDLARHEVAADAVLEATRLSHVQQLAFAAVHAIDAGSSRSAATKFFESNSLTGREYSLTDGSV